MGPEPPVEAPPVTGIEAAIEPNVWPTEADMPGWTETIIDYFRALETFGTLIVGSIARYLKVSDKSAQKRYENSNSTLRLLDYPAEKAESEAMRDDGGTKRPETHLFHSDNDGLGIGWQDSKGLQVQTPSGDWHYIPQIPNGYSVHLGDAMETQTAGRMQATPHRVLGQGLKRRSIVFFLEPGLFASVKPFSLEDNEGQTPLADSYAESIMATLRSSGRA